MLDGAAQGLWASIKLDEPARDGRVVTLWSSIGGGLAAGDRVQLTAGCDKRMTTCQLKFNNMLNFQGFPDLPHEDWVMAVSKRSSQHKGGSRR